MYIPFAFILIMSAVFFLPADTHAKEAAPPRVVENVILDQTLRLEGSDWDGAVVRNVTIRNADGDGIVVRGVKGLRIENCTITNVTGHGIKLSIAERTRDVHIVGNQISDVDKDGIIVGQRHDRGIDHPGLVVKGNRIERTGRGNSNGPHHGIYVQSTDFVIEGNFVSESVGNGISVRSSGIVRNNEVRGTGRSGIAYYADHMRGPSDVLIVEENRISDTGRLQRRADIDLLNIPHPDMTVRNFIIRDNRMVRPPRIHPDYASLGILPIVTTRAPLPKVKIE